MYGKFLLVLLVAIGASKAASVQKDTAPIECSTITNINDEIPDIKRDFFGKIGVAKKSEVQLALTMANTTARITFDDDVRSSKISLGINIEPAGTFTLYIKNKAGKVINMRKGTHTIKTGNGFNLILHILETGPDFNKYAFLVYLNSKPWFLFEEQPEVEIVNANYLSISGLTVRGVKQCVEHLEQQ